MTQSSMITLNNGVEMPALGLGVLRSDAGTLVANVQFALENGYRMIDTAAAYRNEAEVGEGVRRSGVNRSEIFIITKVFLGDHGYDETMRGFESSLEKLGMDYVDMYLLHWPAPATFDLTVDSYRAMERLLSEGRVRAIGTCNFNPDHMDLLRERTGVLPALDQVEVHPYFAQRPLRAYNAALGITTQAWSPIGGTVKRSGSTHDPLEETAIVAVARRHGKTPAQVILRWHLQNGLSVIPKSSNPRRLVENIDVFDFELDAAEMAAIDELDTGTRSGADPDKMDLAMLVGRHAP